MPGRHHSYGWLGGVGVNVIGTCAFPPWSQYLACAQVFRNAVLENFHRIWQVAGRKRLVNPESSTTSSNGEVTSV